MSTSHPNVGKLVSPDINTGVRDAIHVAVISVVADTYLKPGEHYNNVGIVDPYLEHMVAIGERFWLFLYPNTVTTLRHQWTHPEFPDIEPVNEKLPADKEISKKFLEDFADRLFSYDSYEGYTKLEMLLNGLEDGSGHFGMDIEYGDDCKPSEELFKHYEIYTGKKMGEKPEYFRCAC